MSDCSDPEDEIIENTSDSCGHSHAPGHGHSHVHRPARPQVPEGAKNWPAIYPIYLNKFRTREQGRRIAKEEAVENPTFYEIKEILEHEGFKVFVENKVHPREPDRFFPLGPPPMGNPHRGRVKFQYKNADGTLCNPKFKNKHSLYSYIAQMIPKLKSRVEAVRMRDQAAKQKQQAAQAQSSVKLCLNASEYTSKDYHFILMYVPCSRMAPTVRVGSDSGSRTPSRRAQDTPRSGLICRVKYTNKLPDIPFDPKSVKVYPNGRDRFVEYKPTTLEKLCKVELHTDFDLDVNIDLIDPETYTVKPGTVLHPEDSKLLQEEDSKKNDSRRSGIHNRQLTFFRPSEYISQDFKQYGSNAKDKVESKLGAGVKDRFKDEEIYKDRDAQIKAIEKTFKDVQQDVSEHYSKKDVHAVEVLPLLPDFETWKHPCAQVIFDTDPAPKGHSKEAQLDIMSQAIIRGMQDEENQQFVAYFLPTQETMEQRTRDKSLGLDFDDDTTYDYKLAKEYNWNVKNKASKGYEENFFFCYRPNDGVYYNELETRVRLSKRVRQKTTEGVDNLTNYFNTVLRVQHRENTEDEDKAQKMRENALMNTSDHSDEDDDDSSDASSVAAKDSDAEGEPGESSPKRRGTNSDSDSNDEGDTTARAGETITKSDSDSDSDDDADAQKKVFGDSDSDSSMSE
ncbi:Oidioi.mRNA.OKI2018_I69.chr2.g6197.t1.cds [Oikopleura dioica]|uniref:RNA polymerase II-associated factor 1 homolog n=1 Tax=Oikopleura dioica TaxID=34765 RepID=A0ABN7T2T5_OIKDI|nr:Oidioi.mRNA.OKI2018_I69.chr2.g6197.t1.cds [Oikopleura dioica]